MSLLGFSFRFMLASLLFYLEYSRPLLTDPCENLSVHTHTKERKGPFKIHSFYCSFKFCLCSIENSVGT